jgi:hypothetical protein
MLQNSFKQHMVLGQPLDRLYQEVCESQLKPVF